MESVLVKILYGLIAMAVIGPFFAVTGSVIQKKYSEFTATKTKPSGSFLGGIMIYLLIVVLWSVGLVWYWLNILADIS